jgi:hypothetical protein
MEDGPEYSEIDGDRIHYPPAESCPRCGRKYSLRYFADARTYKDKIKSGEQNPDPWSGEEIRV